MILRDYQDAAIESVFEYFESGKTGNPIIAMPTGVGKSLVIAGFIQRVFSMYPYSRILKMTHVKELLGQNLEKLLALWPTAPAGVYSAGLKRKETHFPITFAGVSSIARADLAAFGYVDLVLIDECHLLSPDENTMYQKIIAELKKINPNLKVIGLTATHFRLGQGLLTDEGGLFTDICFDAVSMDSFNWFINEGYLVPLIPKRTNMELDTSGVHMSAGDYKQKELQAAVDKESITRAALNEAIAVGENRRCWLVFASGIEHAEHVATMLNDEFDISAVAVHSKMASGMRDERIAAFKRGEVQAIVNNGILTTGFDHPPIDMIIMLRPTESTSLWIQMLGRGTRPFYEPGFDLSTAEGRLAAIANSIKQNCLVLDFARNTARLGPINDPVLPRKKGKGKGEAPVKICDVCGTYNHASVRFCAACGAEFARSVKIGFNASTEALIATSEMKLEVFAVDKVTYELHHKEGKPPSIRINYYCGLRLFNNYLTLEHGGFPAKKARNLWRERADTEPPATSVEAMGRLDELKVPTHIRVWLKSAHHKYDEVMAYCYDGSGFEEK